MLKRSIHLSFQIVPFLAIFALFNAVKGYSSYLSKDLEPHQILRLSFVSLEEESIKPKFTYNESTEPRIHLYKPQEAFSYEINESDVLRSSVSPTGEVSLGTDELYAWLGFHKPIKHEHAPLKILTHDGVAFGTNCILTGKTSLVVVPYCTSSVQSVTFTSVNPDFPIELKGCLSLVTEEQRSGKSFHEHTPLPFISGGSLFELSPCKIFETNLLCVNARIAITMKDEKYF